jgi:hypothetical protein
MPSSPPPGRRDADKPPDDDWGDSLEVEVAWDDDEDPEGTGGNTKHGTAGGASTRLVDRDNESDPDSPGSLAARRRARLHDVDAPRHATAFRGASSDDQIAWDDDDDPAAATPDPLLADFDPDHPDDDLLAAAEDDIAPLLRRALPLPPRWRRRLPPTALRLYSYITWSSHRDLDAVRLASRWTLLSVPLSVLLVFTPIVLLDQRVPTMFYLIATLLTGALAYFALSGIMSAPSPFSRWLFNIGRRGFLEQLYMARVDARDILAAFLHARIPPVATFMLGASLTLGMSCAVAELAIPNPGHTLMLLQVALTTGMSIGALIEYLQLVAVKRGKVGAGAMAASLPRALFVAALLVPSALAVAIFAGGFLRDGYLIRPPSNWRAWEAIWVAGWCLSHPMFLFPLIAIPASFSAGRATALPKLRDLPIVWDDIVARTLAVAEESR